MISRAPRFRVIETYTLASHRHFILIGDIVEGLVRPGMRFPLPADAPAGCSDRIVGVESVDDLRERVFKTGLRIAYASAEDLSFWESLPLEGNEVELLGDPEPVA